MILNEIKGICKGEADYHQQAQTLFYCKAVKRELLKIVSGWIWHVPRSRSELVISSSFPGVKGKLLALTW